jgi:hypothetical protein
MFIDNETQSDVSIFDLRNSSSAIVLLFSPVADALVSELAIAGVEVVGHRTTPSFTSPSATSALAASSSVSPLAIGMHTPPEASIQQSRITDDELSLTMIAAQQLAQLHETVATRQVQQQSQTTPSTPTSASDWKDYPRIIAMKQIRSDNDDVNILELFDALVRSATVADWTMKKSLLYPGETRVPSILCINQKDLAPSKFNVSFVFSCDSASHHATPADRDEWQCQSRLASISKCRQLSTAATERPVSTSTILLHTEE